jgi:hypothetical protein
VWRLRQAKVLSQPNAATVFQEQILTLNKTQRDAVLLSMRTALLRHFLEKRAYPTDRLAEPHSPPFSCDYCTLSCQQHISYCGQCLFEQVLRPAVLDAFRLV